MREMREKISIVCIIMLVLLFVGGSVFAIEKLPDGYPNKPITLIHAFGFGGGGDTFNRNIAVPAGRITKVPINCINVTGGSTTSAVAYLLNQPADGYTIAGFVSTYALDEAYKRYKEPFLESFEPVIGIASDGCQIYVRTESPFKTFKELINYAKANPGKLKIAGSDAGGTRELGVREIFKAVGAEVIYVPFVGGTSLILPEVLTGRVDASYDMKGPMISMLKAGEVRMLVTSGDKRMEDYPDVPTFKELGYPNLHLALFRGIFVRRNTPPERIKYLHDVFKEAMYTSQFQAIAMALSYNLNYLPTEEFSKYIRETAKVYDNILKELGYIK